MAMKVEAARLMVYFAAACGVRPGWRSSLRLRNACASDAKITQIYEGTNQIQRVVMSRAVPAMRRMQLPTHQPKARPSVFRSGVGGVAESVSGAERKSIRLPVTRVGVARARGAGH